MFRDCVILLLIFELTVLSFANLQIKKPLPY